MIRRIWCKYFGLAMGDATGDGFIDIQPPVNWFTIPSGRRLEWVRGQAVELDDPQNATQASRPAWRSALGRAYGWPPLGFALKLEKGAPPNPDDPPFPTAMRITLRVVDQNESLYSPKFTPSQIPPGQEMMVSDGAIQEIIIHRF